MASVSARAGSLLLSMAGLAIAALATPEPAAARGEIVDGRMDPPVTVRHKAAMQAGHTALYLCTGAFETNLPMDVVRRDAMLDEMDTAVLPEELRVDIDEKRRRVSVEYLSDMPPRVAVWRPMLGCAQLPVGASVEAADHVARLPEKVRAPDQDAMAWPQGEANATRPLPDAQARALAEVMEAASDSRAYGGRTWGVVVVKDGAIVAERYGRGYDEHSLQRTHSAAKSIAATVIGAAVQQNLLNVDAPAPIAEWRSPGDPRAAITLDDLLRMASGLYTEGGGNPQQEIYLTGARVAERSVGNVLDSMPGTRYVYAGSDTLLAVRALRTVLDDRERYLRFPFEQVLWKVGMTRTVLETDWNGDFLMSGQAYASARDLARLGLLYLNDGLWNGERLLPRGWAEYVSRPGPAQPAGSWASADCEDECGGRAYGAQFWVPKPGDGLPPGSYMASGGRGQYVLVVPERDVVIVRRGTDLARRHVNSEEDRQLTRFEMERFARDVLNVLHDEAPAAGRSNASWVPRDQGPGRGAWTFAEPEAHGLSREALAAAADRVGRIAGRQGLVVVRNGHIVHEAYWGNAYQEPVPAFRNVSFSAGKSWGSAMVGRAVTEDLLDVDDLVERYHPPARSGLRPGTTIRHLLTMSSGGTLLYKPSSVRPVPLAQRSTRERPRGHGYRRAEKPADDAPPGYATTLEPGRVFYYDGEPADHLSSVVANAVGMPSLDYMWQHVLTPLGVESFQFQPEGIDPDGNVRIGGSIEMSVRDLARLGQLWLNKGRWGGDQLIDAAYVEESVTPSALNPNYGFLWWLSGRLQGAPSSLFFASGAFGQLLFVLPEQNMVIATMGFSGPPRPEQPAQQLWDAVAPALPLTESEK